MGQGFWTEDKVTKLRKMVNDGYSFTLIGEAVGCSRNAAIGKALRLNIQSQNTKGGKLKSDKVNTTPHAPRKGTHTTQTPKDPPAVAVSRPVEVEKPLVSPVPPYQQLRALPSGR